MKATTRQGHLQFPAAWKHVESSGVGPFTTRIVHQPAEGVRRIWTSRRNRLGFGTETLTVGKVQPHGGQRLPLLLWAPHKLTWWIALLFMIGSALFSLGSVFFLGGSYNSALINVTFFIGSLFFTSAGYLSYNQAINAPTTVGVEMQPQRRKYFAWQPGHIDYWITSTLFLGTILFNINTFDASLDLGWLGQDLLIWVPDMIGSTLFLVSGASGVFELCHRLWCRPDGSISWWVVNLNFAGCIAFMISAILALVRPEPIFDNLATYATIFTLIGAVCFFVSSYLMWPEMASASISR